MKLQKILKKICLTYLFKKDLTNNLIGTDPTRPIDHWIENHPDHPGDHPRDHPGDHTGDHPEDHQGDRPIEDHPGETSENK